MDFDRCTGQFSNPSHHTKTEFHDNAWMVGAAFSPNSSVLYLSSFQYVYQFDLTVTNYFSTKTTVAVYDSSGYSFYLAELAHNGKIYMIPTGGSNIFHVINYPDSLGMSCDVRQHDLILPKQNLSTIPHFPNFRLGAEHGSACDSLFFEGVATPEHLPGRIELFPNPANRIAYLALPEQNGFNISLIDALGRKKEIPLHFSSSLVELDISSLEPACYFVIARNKKSVYVKRLVKY